MTGSSDGSVGGAAASGGRRVWDEGLQAERTALAWERSALALVANAALLLRAGGQGVPEARVLAFVVFGAAGVGLLGARSRYTRRDASLRGEARVPGHRTLLALGSTVVAISVAVLVVVVRLAVT